MNPAGRAVFLRTAPPHRVLSAPRRRGV